MAEAPETSNRAGSKNQIHIIEMQCLNKKQKDAFESLLKEFKDIFANLTEDLGCAWDETHIVNVGGLGAHLSKSLL